MVVDEADEVVVVVECVLVPADELEVDVVWCLLFVVFGVVVVVFRLAMSSQDEDDEDVEDEVRQLTNAFVERNRGLHGLGLLVVEVVVDG